MCKYIIYIYLFAFTGFLCLLGQEQLVSIFRGRAWGVFLLLFVLALTLLKEKIIQMQKHCLSLRKNQIPLLKRVKRTGKSVNVLSVQIVLIAAQSDLG